MDPNTSGSQGASGVRVVTRKYLFHKMQSFNLKNLEDKLNLLESQLISCENDKEKEMKRFKSKFAHFKSQIQQRWLKAHRTEEVFIKSNHSWLDGTFELPAMAQNRPGRPSKSFNEVSERSKRRKTEDVRSTLEKDVIIHAAQVELRNAGQRDASDILKDITSTPTRATKYKKAFTKLKSDKACSLTPVQALSMFVEADLSRRQYEIVRNTNKNFFPCYTLLQKAKQECYPPPASCRVTSTYAETDLQPLVDHTVKRLSIYLEEVLTTLKEQERESLKLISKWGCDGSHQSQFKQIFENDADSDANIFQSCFVPLRLVTGNEDVKLIWQNPTPSSPRFCRPIRFRFIKENTDITEDEINYVKKSANSLNITEVDLNGDKFSVTHVFIMTMVDGKVCNSATGTTSTSRCYICGATSKDFNKIDVQKEVNPEAIEFGLSVLHARIRLFESILHLAYKLPVKKYRERKTDAEKNMELEKKLEIQKRFRQETGLLVDIPKANFGNTNDGNTSRRFFEDPILASDITGISYDLIFRLKVILEAISSGHIIDAEKYDNYALDTARLYVQLYPWHPMSPTMHKVLVHGAVIIKNALLPIGQLSEEAAEARNKHFRSYRQDFARKFSRENCNRDIFNRLLLTSDPLISSMRSVIKRRVNCYLPETMALFMPAKPNLASDFSESDEDSH